MTIDHEHERATRRFPGRLIAVTAVVAVGLTAAVAMWLLMVRSPSDDGAAPAGKTSVELVTVAQLQALAETAEEPVFWAGPRDDMRYELSRTPSGRIYIRYLPEGVEAGDPRAGYLTVGTYPVDDALGDTRRSGEADGAVVRELEGGGLAVYNKSSPTSVFVAFPGTPRLIEVYDPSPATAQELAYSGRVKPILADSAPPEQTGRPVAATEDELRKAAADLGHPLYWAGPKPGVTYELTRLPDGQVFVRYLPEGIGVGDQRPDYLVVGTYPTEDGPAAARAAGGAGDAVSFGLPNGDVAYYNPDSPTNVHFAPPGSKFQVEVFHPDAAEAKRLVSTGTVEPIR